MRGDYRQNESIELCNSVGPFYRSTLLIELIVSVLMNDRPVTERENPKSSPNSSVCNMPGNQWFQFL